LELHDFGLHGIESHRIDFHTDEMLKPSREKARKLKRELGGFRRLVLLIRNLRRIPPEDYLQVSAGI